VTAADLLRDPVAGTVAAPKEEDGVDLLFDLLDEVDALLRAALPRMRSGGGATIDPALRGLVVTEPEAERLLERVPGVAGDGDGGQGGALWRRAAPRLEAARVAGAPHRLDVVRERFRLSVFEVEALVVCLAGDIDSRYEKLFGYLNDDVSRKWPTVQLLLHLLAPPGERPIRFRRHLLPDAPLLQARLLGYADEARPGQEPPFLGRELRVEPGVTRFLLAEPGVDAELLAAWDTSPRATPARDAAGYLAARARLDAVWDAGASLIVVRGRAGAGRRRLIEDVCAAREVGLIRLDAHRVTRADAADRMLAAAYRDGLLCGVPVLLAEAQVLWAAPEGGGEASRALPHLLERWPGMTFFTVQPDAPLPPWLRRAGAVEVTLPPLTFSERRDSWDERLGALSALAPETRRAISETLAARFRLTPADMDSAVREAALSLGPGPGSPDAAAALHRATARVSAPQLSDLAQRLEPRFCWSDLVLPARRLDLLRDIVRQVEHRRTVLEHWGFGRRRTGGLHVLFAGPAGTGKTMAAEIIANTLGMELYRIDLSAVVSKYIGETEKNLRRIFHEAEQGDAILFFDEADALFGKRSEIRDAHDRYANIEVNYLLQRMEQFAGISILATNLRQNLDDAFLRRLAVVVEFPLPDAADRRRLWDTAFPAEAPRARDLDLAFLAQRFELSGGSIHNCALTAAFLAAEAGEPIGMAHCAPAVQRELEKLGKRAVQEDFGPYFGLLRPAGAAADSGRN
jgi:hypothetical protein